MAFLEGFRDYDPELLVRDRTPDCQQIMAPASLGISEVWSNDHVANFYRALRTDVLRQCIFTIKEVLEDEANNKILIWLSSHATFHQVSDGGGEYMFLLEFNEDQTKVKRFVEFVDVVKATNIRDKIQESLQILGRATLDDEIAKNANGT
jgi:hypothetical protein